MNTKFNPVKEEVAGKKARRMVWSTESIEAALKGLEQGRKLIANPFYENNTKILKGDLVFERTDEEIKEWLKCKKDVLYFAKKCKLMTPEGIQHIELRDYQKNYLKHLQENRLSIYLSCRQSGKCLSLVTVIPCKLTDNFLSHIDDKLKQRWYSLYYTADTDIFQIPLFELYNVYDKRLIWKVKYPLYKLLYRLICIKAQKENPIDMIDRLIQIAIIIISWIDKHERDDEKLIQSFVLDDVSVQTDTGFQKASYIHQTKAFQIYNIKLSNGYRLECADTHILFDKHMNEVFVKDLCIGDGVMTDLGIIPIVDITISQYKICMGDITIDDANHRYYSNGILSHNTTTSAIFMLHYILFNTDKNSLVLGNKRKTAVEILTKVKNIYTELPYYLKPGVYKWNEGEIVLDNGCRCMAEATTINSGISFTFHCVLADEFAHIQPNIMEPFYNNLFPTITAGKARFMITSTQNGYNLFYRLYKAAEAHLSEYQAFKTDWYEVPEWNPETKQWEKRDEKWHQMQVANYGSEEAFNKQFGTNFDINANTLIDTKFIKKIRSEAVEFVNKEIPGVEYSDRFFWHPQFDPMVDLKTSYTVVTIDIAEGKDQDYTTYIFNRIINQDGDTECIGIFHANDLDVNQCTRALRELVCFHCNQSNLLISLETNLFGELFVKQLCDDTITNTANFDPSNIIKYWNKAGTEYTYGIRMTAGNKPKGCVLFKNDYEKNKIINRSTLFLNEIENFSDTKGTGTYAASFGHDDVVMAQMQLVFAKQSLQFKYLQDGYNSGKTVTSDNIYNPYDDAGWMDWGTYQSSSLSRLNRLT